MKVAGEGSSEEEGESWQLQSKSVGQRALYVFGGAFMNFVFAVVLFIIAFSMGVPLAVGEVGETEPGSAAWLAGLRAGDRIVTVDGVQNPVFKDVLRAVALGGDDAIDLRVERDGRTMDVTLRPSYNEQLGYKVVGILPPVEPTVSRLVRIGGEDGRCPAEEAGMEIADRILAINGHEVRTARDVQRELLQHPGDEVEVLLERGEQRLTLSVLTEPLPRHMIGISGLSSTVAALQADAPAQQMGLRVGDRVVAVGGQPVVSAVAIERTLREARGLASLVVERDGEEVVLELAATDLLAVSDFLDSVVFESSNTLTWVSEDGPAWEAGMRPGDTIVAVGDTDASTWEEVHAALSSRSSEAHEITWSRDGETFAARVEPVADASLSGGHLGMTMERPVTVRKRYGAWGAVKRGFVNTYETLTEVVLTLRGVATRQVSPRTVGGIVTIAYYSYQAAQLGLSRLVHLTAMISAAVGCMNLLPIPVLDGGYLLMLAIEKVRGRRPAERAVNIAQSIGLALLLMLVVYVTWNDIRRLLMR